jgi:hypothetical protein
MHAAPAKPTAPAPFAVPVPAPAPLPSQQHEHGKELKRLRCGRLLATLPFWQRSRAWLLSSRFNHSRSNGTDRFELGTSRRGRARCAFLLDWGVSFNRCGSCRDNWSWRRRCFQVRRAFSGWLRNSSFFLSLHSKRSCRAHLVERGRDGFLFFARLGFGSCRCGRFRRGLLRLRRWRCLLGSLRFCLMRNDYFLRMHHLDDKENAAE